MHLFLSPHLDDAVLSCGGTIHQLAQQGQAVTILTIMAGDPPSQPPDTPIVRDLHQRWQAGYNPAEVRRREDMNAAHRLGAQAIHLPIGDCVYRTIERDGGTLALYPSEESLFGEVSPDDPAMTALEALTLPHADVIYVPMGVGHHVDHQLVRDWGMTLAKPNRATLKFYEEYPYINATMEIDRALAFYQGRLKPEMLLLDESSVRAKIEGIALYSSQISTWWSSLEDMEAATRQSMLLKGEGRPAERFWVLEQ